MSNNNDEKAARARRNLQKKAQDLAKNRDKYLAQNQKIPRNLMKRNLVQLMPAIIIVAATIKIVAQITKTTPEK